MNEQLHIKVSSDRLIRLRAAVEAGDYASLDGIIDAALELWEVSRDEAVKRVRELWDEGLASGMEPWEGMEAIIAKAKREADAERHIPYRAA